MSLADRLRRVATMPPRELAARGATAGRRLVDRWRVHAVPPQWHRERLAAVLDRSRPGMSDIARALGRAGWHDAHVALSGHFATRAARFLVHPALREELRRRLGTSLDRRAEEARAAGRRIAAREYDLLGYQRLRFDTRRGDIDWHLDPVSGRRAPRECWTDIDYLDPRIGDHKVIWELNRHQHWVILGRAWWLAGDERCRDAFVGELESWLRANPPLLGINWASALELGFRALSWLWALELFVDADRARSETPWTVDLLAALDRQLRHVEQHLSRYFSPNTHLLGEALALYVCGQALPELRRSPVWIRTGRAVLLEETQRQVLPDGGHAERSPHYHRYALEFYLLALATARLAGDATFAAALEPVVLRMSTFMHHVCDVEGRFPSIGDDDGGELVPIAGHQHQHARTSLGWAAALLRRGDLRVEPVPEAVTWLTLHEPAKPPAGERLPSLQRTALFPESGYLAVRRGTSHTLVDVGPHGFLNGGHAHADALSVCVVARGLPLLVDPGTGTYTVDRALRDRIRSSQCHNTLTLDERSQSQPCGPFHWAYSSRAELRHSALNPSFDYCEADTSAWAPAVHERMVLCVGDDTWVVADRVLGGERHRADVYWQLDPSWEPAGGGTRAVRLRHAGGSRARLSVPGAALEVIHGTLPGAPGSVSPVYGRFAPSHVVRATVERPAPFWVASVIELLDEADLESEDARLDVLSAARGGAAVVTTHRAGAVDITLCRGRLPRERVTVIVDPARGYAVTTDARVAHARVDAAGRLLRLCLADATELDYDGERAVTITAAEPVADLALVFLDDGSPVVETSAPRRAVAIDVASAAGRPRFTRARRADRGAHASSRSTCVE